MIDQRSEEKLLNGILQQACVEDPDEIARALARHHVRPTDLLQEREDRMEEMLKSAGLLVGDVYKISRVVRNFHSSGGPSSSTTPGGGLLRRLVRPVAANSSMRCGLMMYSTTVLVVSVTVLSFYLPAVLYHVQARQTRIASSAPPQQAYYTTPATWRPSQGEAPPQGPPGAKVMLVTANQPLPCTTRRGDWVMGLALRNKLMYATLHGYKTWWSTELVSSWDLEAAWNKIPLLYILMHNKLPVSEGVEWMRERRARPRRPRRRRRPPARRAPRPAPPPPRLAPAPPPQCGWTTTRSSPTWSSPSPSRSMTRRASTS